jgi:hypothetical protein
VKLDIDETDIAVLAAVYAKSAHASIVRRNPAPDAQPSKCHDNARRYCETHAGFSVATGWIVMPMHGSPIVWLLPHSIVRCPDGNLLDVTPQNDERITLKFVADDSPFLHRAIANNQGHFDFMPVNTVRGLNE